MGTICWHRIEIEIETEALAECESEAGDSSSDLM